MRYKRNSHYRRLKLCYCISKNKIIKENNIER